jgi:hypothetical protein
VTFTVTHGYYQMVIVATGEDVISPKTVAIGGHNGDGRFDDITEQPL